jgi:hypothetical protein
METVSSGAPTVDPTLATLQLAVYPPERRTGIAELDLIIDAVMGHNFPALKELTAYTKIGCTTTDGLGGPPKCAEGEAEGTVVEVVPFLGPEGHHQRREEYQEWQGPDVLGLLAVYRVLLTADSFPSYPAGEYALVFLDPSGLTTVTLQVREGRVIRYDYDFSGSVESDLENKASEVILGLAFRPIPTAVAWNPFSDPQGRFSFLYPPLMELVPAETEDSWILQNQIRIEVLDPENSWISCFYQSLGDCPFAETDQMVDINGQEARVIKGYIGAVGGNTPQEFLSYIFNLGNEALVMTLYALPFGTEVSDPGQIWPLGGMELDLFQRSVETVQLFD